MLLSLIELRSSLVRKNKVYKARQTEIDALCPKSCPGGQEKMLTENCRKVDVKFPALCGQCVCRTGPVQCGDAHLSGILMSSIHQHCMKTIAACEFPGEKSMRRQYQDG